MVGRYARSAATSRPQVLRDASTAVAAACVVLCGALSLTAVVAATSRSDTSRQPHTTTPIGPPAPHGPATPVWFEPNVGQSASGAPFIAKLGGGDTMAISATHTSIAVGSSSPQSQVDLTLIGANPTATVAGADKELGTANYFAGNRAQWRTHVPMFGRVVATSVYPGINLVWRAGGSGAEYDFSVAPNADPSDIHWHITGATSLRIDKSGALLIGTTSGTVTENAPQAYQVIDGAAQAVPSRFVVRDSDVRFAVGHYDHARTLVIDPTLTFSTYFPGNGWGSGYALGLDSQDNAYVLNAGSVQKFNSAGTLLWTSTLTGGPGPTPQVLHDLAVDAAGDSFVVNGGLITELDPTGASMLYSATLPGATITGVAVGPGNTAYVTGTTTGGLPTTSGAFQTSSSGKTEVFIAKIDPSVAGDGTGTLSVTNPQLEYSSYIGTDYPGNYDSNIAFPDITADGNGNAYVSGTTNDTSYPVTAGTLQQPPASGFTGGNGTNPDAAFVSELSPSGNGAADLVYSTLLFGATPNSTNTRHQAVNQAFGLALGPSVLTGGPPTIDVVGATGAGDFPVTAHAFQPNPSTCNGDFVMCDAFYARINPAGTGASDLVYSTYLGGSLNEAAFDVTSDAEGHAFLTGFTWSFNFPATSNAIQPMKCCPSSPYEDAFVTEIDPSASGTASLLYSTFLGGSGSDWGNGVALGANGTLFATGYTDSPAMLKGFKIKKVRFPVTTSRKQTVIGHGYLSIISGL